MMLAERRPDKRSGGLDLSDKVNIRDLEYLVLRRQSLGIRWMIASIAYEGLVTDRSQTATIFLRAARVTLPMAERQKNKIHGFYCSRQFAY